MHQPMLISVIIPCYNAEEYVAIAIRSVQMQTFRNWRLIVVDDGSTDGSWAAIDRALGTDPRCTGIRTENHGVAAARNLAIDRAGDGLIVPLDADDWLYPDALYEFAMAFSHVPGLMLAVPQDHRKGEGIDKIVAHTWHGDGYLAGEVSRLSVSSTVQEDRTNHYNNSQGAFRYGILDINSLRDRIIKDARGIPFEVEVTHCDEMDRLSEFSKAFGRVNAIDSPLV